MPATIDQLIINTPYHEPARYWSYDRDTRTFTLKEGTRRPAGYVRATPNAQAFDDPGVFVPLELANLYSSACARVAPGWLPRRKRNHEAAA